MSMQNASPEQAASHNTTLTFFNKLPAEIRNRIYEFALPRTLVIMNGPGDTIRVKDPFFVTSSSGNEWRTAFPKRHCCVSARSSGVRLARSSGRHSKFTTSSTANKLDNGLAPKVEARELLVCMKWLPKGQGQTNEVDFSVLGDELVVKVPKSTEDLPRNPPFWVMHSEVVEVLGSMLRRELKQTTIVEEQMEQAARMMKGLSMGRIMTEKGWRRVDDLCSGNESVCPR